MFRFTIRDVLWLTVVVGFAAGWWVDHWQQSLRQVELHDEIQRLYDLIPPPTITPPAEKVGRDI
jgi:hypothetical protein